MNETLEVEVQSESFVGRSEDKKRTYVEPRESQRDFEAEREEYLRDTYSPTAD